jgi:hypothetical protein
MAEFKPGKGFFGDATEASLEFFKFALEAIEYAYKACGGDEIADTAAEGGNMKPMWVKIKNMLTDDPQELDWKVESDRFGDKVYAAKKWGDTEYRVTFVLTSRGQFKLDVRQWYT